MPVSEAAVYVARTKSRLHRLTVTARPGTGRFTVIPTPFNEPHERQSSWLSPFRILQRRTADWDGDIAAMASPGNKFLSKTKEAIARGGQERPVWVLTKKHLMKWNVNLEGGEEVFQAIHGTLRDLDSSAAYSSV